MTTAEKRALLEQRGDAWPVCSCHQEPMRWQADVRLLAGGSVKAREAWRRYLSRRWRRGGVTTIGDRIPELRRRGLPASCDVCGAQDRVKPRDALNVTADLAGWVSALCGRCADRHRRRRRDETP
jgi:hypothetical protein